MAKEQMTTLPALQMKRTFQAPRERVFRAWTDPKELAQWFHASPDYSTLVPEMDLRVGGKYRMEMHHKGGNVHRLGGTYREIEPPEKVVFTWRWEADPNADESLVTVEFRDLGQSTEILPFARAICRAPRSARSTIKVGTDASNSSRNICKAGPPDFRVAGVERKSQSNSKGATMAIIDSILMETGSGSEDHAARSRTRSGGQAHLEASRQVQFPRETGHAHRARAGLPGGCGQQG